MQAICDFVHQRVNFGYEHARVTRTASEAYQEGRGVCRDYAHLAVAFCRALNIPARYCTGYLGDVGTPPPFPPGDFAAWFEAYLGGGEDTSFTVNPGRMLSEMLDIDGSRYVTLAEYPADPGATPAEEIPARS